VVSGVELAFAGFWLTTTTPGTTGPLLICTNLGATVTGVFAGVPEVPVVPLVLFPSPAMGSVPPGVVVTAGLLKKKK